MPQIAEAVDAITAAFQQGGRLIYSGAALPGDWVFSMPANVRLPSARRASRWWG